jgi:hypothetical protein
MDAATVKEMLEQHFAASDPDLGHAMYHDDAVLEFPQSGERFVGVENLRAWRSNYPASTSVAFREVRGRGDLWIAELTIRYDSGPSNFGISILELRGDKIARETIYVSEGWDAPVAGPVALRAVASSRNIRSSVVGRRSCPPRSPCRRWSGRRSRRA